MTHPQKTTREVLEQDMQETKEMVAVAAFLSAMHDQGLNGAEVRKAMLTMLGMAHPTPSTTGEVVINELSEAEITLLIENYYDTSETPADLIKRVVRLCGGSCGHRPACEECNQYKETATPPQVEPASGQFLEINYLQAGEHEHEYHYFGRMQHRRCRHCNEPGPAPSPEQALQRLSELRQQFQPEEF